MSHPEQLAFFELISTANAELVSGGRVIEIGSYDVNGTVRGLFSGAAEYVGVDLIEGPGVDRVSYGHEVADSDGTYDVAISGECFEHDPYYSKTFTNMIRLTRPGGVVAFTCASRGRPEHGTRRTLAKDSPGTQAEELDYYRNVTAEDFSKADLERDFSSWGFWYLPTTFDLYFAGVKRGGDAGPRLPASEDVERIRDLMTFPHRVVRWPLRVALRFTDGGATYQRIVLPYWLRMVRAFG